MRLTALLLLTALAGTLVCAQNTTTADTQTPSHEPETTAPEKSASAQETTSEAAQETSATTGKQKLGPLNSAINKGLEAAKKAVKAVENTEKNILKAIQDGLAKVFKLG